MSYEVYKLIHILGALGLFLALGSVVGSDKGKIRWAAPVHGIGLLLIVIAGFGMLGRLGIRSSLPSWVIGKLVVWVLLGLSLSLAKRKLLPSSLFMVTFVFLGGIATYLALWKP